MSSQPIFLTFPAGAQPGHTISFAVSVVLDQIVENTEEFGLNLIASAGQPLVDIDTMRNTAVVAITDNSGRLDV